MAIDLACWLIDCVQILRPTRHQNRSFRRHSSKSISRIGTEETQHNKSKQHLNENYLSITQRNNNGKPKQIGLHKTKSRPKPKSTRKFKNCSHVRAYHCAQLSYTTQHRTVLIIFPPNLQTTITAQLLSIGGEGAV